jgi:hypothetical protein
LQARVEQRDPFDSARSCSRVSERPDKRLCLGGVIFYKKYIIAHMASLSPNIGGPSPKSTQPIYGLENRERG